MIGLRVAIACACLAGCHIYEGTASDPDARVADARARPDAAPDAATPDAWVPLPRICQDAELTASVSGTTPLGALAYNHVWPGYFGGKCSGVEIHLTAGNNVDANAFWSWPAGVDSLTFWLGDSWPDGFVTTHEDVRFNLVLGGQTSSATGTVTVHDFEEPWFGSEQTGLVAGSISVADEEAGWALTGTFRSSFCEHLITACP